MVLVQFTFSLFTFVRFCTADKLCATLVTSSARVSMCMTLGTGVGELVAVGSAVAVLLNDTTEL